MTKWYPLMLDLSGRTCLIIGGGAVVARKIEGLLGAGALVIVISPALHPALIALAEEGKIIVHQIAYAPGILVSFHPLLVFAATDNAVVNQQVVNEARSLGALVNAVDEHGDRDFLSMAAIHRGEITIAVSLSGASPALASHLQTKIETLVGIEYQTLADWMAQARPLLKSTVKSQPERAAVWRQVIESSILDTLRQGDEERARQQFDQIIQKAIDNQA